MTRCDAPTQLARPLLVVVLVVLLGACGSTPIDESATPTTDERAVCDGVQGLVDAIVGSDAATAMLGLDELERAVAATENTRLRTNGTAFFATINETVPDPGSLTPEQSSAVGDDALARAQPRLDALLAECAQLGLSIQNLPEAPASP